jgi:hypothetical protein
MEERELGAIHDWKEFRPVVLIVVDERTKSLVQILIHNLRLTICLGIESGREFEFNAQDTAKLVLEVGD